MTEHIRPVEHQTDESRNANPQHVGYETRDVRFWGVALFGVGLVVLIAVAMGLMRGLANRWGDGRHQRIGTSTRRDPGPTVRDALRSDQQRLRMRQQQQRREVLASYGWLNREQGIAQIPIEQAMKLLAERGDLSFPRHEDTETGEAGPGGAQSDRP